MSNTRALVLCLAVLAVLAPYWRAIGTTDSQFLNLFCGTVAETILVAPHALFSEAGLLILPMIDLNDRWKPGITHLQPNFRRSLLTIAALLCLNSTH